MSATMTSIKCPNCGHTADDHKPGRGCLDCQCMYDPRQILLERIAQQDAVIEAAREALQNIVKHCESARLRQVDTGDPVQLAVYLALHEAQAALEELKAAEGGEG